MAASRWRGSRFDVEEQRWDRYIVGAPAAVNSFELVADGEVLVARTAAPAGVEEEAGNSEDQEKSKAAYGEELRTVR